MMTQPETIMSSCTLECRRVGLADVDAFANTLKSRRAKGRSGFGETVLHAGLQVADAQNADLFAPASVTRYAIENLGEYIAEPAWHIRGERFHRLDGLWRRPDGRYLLFEAKGRLNSANARHVVEKLHHWMVLAHGRDDVVRAWMLDWLLMRTKRGWQSRDVQVGVEHALFAEISGAIGPWDSLVNGPPDIVVLCDGQVGSSAMRTLREFWDQWQHQLEGGVQEVVQVVGHEGPWLEVEVVPIGGS